MCGRFALSSPAEMVRKHFNLSEDIHIVPRYNIAPGQMIPVIRMGSKGAVEFTPMHWGLIPSWAKEKRIGYKLINARGETLDEKPSFKRSFSAHRCLIPADGFYEWKVVAGQKRKQPYFFQMKEGGLFGFAGLWSSWRDKANEEIVVSCTIITTEPNLDVVEIHNRMPVILQPEQYEEWMSQQSDSSLLKDMLVPCDPGLLTRYPVSDLCNSVQNDSPDCVIKSAE